MYSAHKYTNNNPNSVMVVGLSKVIRVYIVTFVVLFRRRRGLYSQAIIKIYLNSERFIYYS